jgi:hypothetical protein
VTAPLTPGAQDAIRSRLDQGERVADLANAFKVSRQTIYRIRHADDRVSRSPGETTLRGFWSGLTTSEHAELWCHAVAAIGSRMNLIPRTARRRLVHALMAERVTSLEAIRAKGRLYWSRCPNVGRVTLHWIEVALLDNDWPDGDYTVERADACHRANAIYRRRYVAPAEHAATSIVCTSSHGR